MEVKVISLHPSFTGLLCEQYVFRVITSHKKPNQKEAPEKFLRRDGKYREHWLGDQCQPCCNGL
jgi:hypothetical protein